MKNTDHKPTISLDRLLNAARDLHSEDGENSEYDRALVELIRDVASLGVTTDMDGDQQRDYIADLIDPRTTVVRGAELVHMGVTTYYVVSWVYWEGDEQGGGGFNWYYTEENARQGFQAEKRAWEGACARVRLVKVQVPTFLDPEAVTAWIDGDIDLIEYHLPALAVALITPERQTA